MKSEKNHVRPQEIIIKIRRENEKMWQEEVLNYDPYLGGTQERIILSTTSHEHRFVLTKKDIEELFYKKLKEKLETEEKVE